ncbi:putative 1-phosphatidylinositol 4-kinase [Rosa chinensis]|uniref:Putative 1-phosphatidylinositol 4-kinase n=1 Tax=Rosa chinensis TaxID=74649 RepID=A0A2P6RRZ0_ROSCH|nr:putative 1-phosphatidylinositol 4-kinase [Rosa chinensis]
MHLVLRLSDLQEINVRTNCGKEFTFHVERGKDVGYVKQKIAKNSKEFVDLEEQEVVLDGKR